MPSILLNMMTTNWDIVAKLSFNTLVSVGDFCKSKTPPTPREVTTASPLMINNLISSSQCNHFWGGGIHHISLLSLFPSGSCSTKGQWTAHIPPTAICHRLPSPPATCSAATEWTFLNNILPPSASRGPTAALTSKVLLLTTKIEWNKMFLEVLAFDFFPLSAIGLCESWFCYENQVVLKL